MPKVTFITHDGKKFAVDAAVDSSAMEAATHNFVPGIDGDCSGALACGTCHVFVTDAWANKLPQPAEGAEKELLLLLDNYEPHSRLACQIKLTDDLDGLVLKMPRGQH